MEGWLLEQLAELTREMGSIGLRPVICGGMGVYLSFYNRAVDGRTSIRATTDIDLMITRSQAVDKATLDALAEKITGPLRYSYAEKNVHFRFSKPGAELDILAMPVDGLRDTGGRVRLVPHKLHGRLTEEACFVEENMRTVELAEFVPEDEGLKGLAVSVPSSTNLLIMKLFAFDDRDEQRENAERAQAHASDVYVISILSDGEDYRQGRELLERHKDSPIVARARSIVKTKFLSTEHRGWLRVMAAPDLFPGLAVAERLPLVEQETPDQMVRRIA
jgi:hypothetical protein